MNHVDPETLAAWSDGGLPSGERLAVESHLADCPQCRAMAAAFGRTLEAPAEVAPAVAAPSIAAATKWILPFAATIVIATGVAWKFWPRAEAPREMAATRATQAPATEGVPRALSPQATAASPVAEPPAAKQPAEKTPARPARSMPTIPAEVSIGVSGGVAGAVPPPPAVQPPPAAMPAPPPPPLSARTTVAGLQNARPPITFTTADAAKAAQERWQIIEFTAGPASVANISGGRGGGGGAARATAPAAAIAVASAPPVRWRATGPNTIERSTDNGATWKPMEIELPPVVLTAGAAPSTNACWFVGKAGVVLLSKNGGAFKRLAFPEAADLVSILATSDRQVTVITSDGRAFVTDDEGQTWRIARF